MSVADPHPEYTAALGDWNLARDAHEGERAIKAARATYLPPTAKHVHDGYGTRNGQGETDYRAYVQRAYYPDYYEEAVSNHLGTMWSKPPAIELPDSMASLHESATALGEPLSTVLRAINERQLMTGRIAVLGDLRERGTEIVPSIALYRELAAPNWAYTMDSDDQARLWLAVLDESGWRLDNFRWVEDRRYRVVALLDQDGRPSPEGRVYATATLPDGADIADAAFTPVTHRGVTLERIPLEFVNADSVRPEPSRPPMMGLLNLTMAIYRGEADYAHTLHMQGQDTFVIRANPPAPPIGADGLPEEDPGVPLGAGSVVFVGEGGSASFEGVGAAGLSEQRLALEGRRALAGIRSGQLDDPTSKAKESGEALAQRRQAQTTRLQSIARTGGDGLESVLRTMAPWFRARPESIEVRPNLDFIGDVVDGRGLSDLQTAKNLGAKISAESIHEVAREMGATKFSYEEELERIAAEPPDFGPAPRGESFGE